MSDLYGLFVVVFELLDKRGTRLGSQKTNRTEGLRKSQIVFLLLFYDSITRALTKELSICALLYSMS